MGERSVYLAFSILPGIGPVKFKKLIKHYGSAKSAWSSTRSDIELVLGKSLTEKFESFRKEFDAERYESELIKKKIDFITLSDKDYPPLLRQISNPPIVLFVKGNSKILRFTQNDNRAIAIVGTRHITSYGKQITQMFAKELSESGLVIVSGLAYGVDGVAHKATIDVKGKTIAVLGNGVDQAYPRENQRLYEEILDSGSLIISEYPPGTPPSVGSFPARNRIVAGLSNGILVTEGASDSGSLITANFGLEFGRKVFAVPGPITSSLSAAPLRLIEKGAKLVVSPDVTRELGLSHFAKASRDMKIYDGLSSGEKKIIELLENESLQFDEIVRRLKLDPSTTGTILSMMELKGIINSSNGAYEISTS